MRPAPAFPRGDRGQAAYGDAQIGVSRAAVGLSASEYAQPSRKPGAVAKILVETAPIRYTTDGTTPTSSVGMLAYPGDVIKIDVPDFAAFRAIRAGSTDAQLDVTYQTPRK